MKTSPPMVIAASRALTPRSARWVRGGVLVAVWVVTWPVLALFASTHGGFDLNIYQHAIQSWWGGHDLYRYAESTTGLGFTYPPFAAVVLSPLVAIPFMVAQPVLLGVNIGLILLTIWWLLRPWAARWGLPTWYLLALLFPLAVALEPIRETLGFGQVNLVLAVLVGVDLVLLARGRSRGVGIAIGVAAAVKLTPAVFILFLFAARRWRAGTTAVVTAVVVTLLAAALDWSMSWTYWTVTLWQTGRVGAPDYVANQSLLGLLARLADSSHPSRLPWLVAALATLVVGLYRAARASRAGDQLGAGTITGLLSCAVSPVGWTHHLVWLLPALAILIEWGVRRRSVARVAVAVGTYVLFASSIIWLWRRGAPHHWDYGLGGLVLENAYVLVVVALIGLLPIRPGSDVMLADPAGPAGPAGSADPADPDGSEGTTAPAAPSWAF